MSELLDYVERMEAERIKGKSRGIPFAKGNELGFKGHPENINRSGKPKQKVISQAYRDALEEDLHDVLLEPIKVKNADGTEREIDGLLGKLEPVARAIKEATGRKPSYAELLAIGMIISASNGNSSAAKEIRETTEGRLPEKIDLSGKIDYTAGAAAKDILTGKLVGKEDEDVDEKKAE